MSTIESALLKKLKEKEGTSGEDTLQNEKKNSRAYSNVMPPQENESIDEVEASPAKVESQEIILETPKAQSKDDSKVVAKKQKSIAAMSQARLFTATELNNRGLISSEVNDQKLLNEYRNIRTRLLSSSQEGNFICLVTSVNAGHDTSLIAANLAATFALESGKTSLLLNADMNYKKKMDQLFDIEPISGLVDFIESDEMSVEDIIYETPIPRLRYVPIGNVGAEMGEYFSTSRMKLLMNDFVSRYKERFPVINAPSITSSADARILLDLCDCVILVVPYGECSQGLIQQAATTIGKNKLAGILLENF